MDNLPLLWYYLTNLLNWIFRLFPSLSLLHICNNYQLSVGNICGHLGDNSSGMNHELNIHWASIYTKHYAIHEETWTQLSSRHLKCSGGGEKADSYTNKLLCTNIPACRQRGTIERLWERRAHLWLGNQTMQWRERKTSPSAPATSEIPKSEFRMVFVCQVQNLVPRERAPRAVFQS